MPNQPILFDYTLYTADDCARCIGYELLPAGAVVARRDSGWDREPELQTTTAVLDIQHGPGGATDRLELTGNDHRDLEGHGLFDDFLREIGAGWSPQVALAKTLESISDAPAPR